MLTAEGLVLPSSLLIAVFLARVLGPGGFGLYALTLAIIMTLELVITFFFSRTTVKLTAELRDPRPVLVTAVRLRLGVDVGCLAALWLVAPLVADALNTAEMTSLLRLAAVDIPLSGLARLSRDALMGGGRFDRRAAASAGRWISRAVLIVVLVWCGLGPAGAIVGHIAASLVELVLCGVRLPLAPTATGQLPLRRFLGYALPLFAYASGLLVFSRIDLLLLKALGATTAGAGVYAAPQNVAHSMGVLTAVLSPVLISLISRRLADGSPELARRAAQSGFRSVLLVAPFIVLVSAAGSPLCVLLFGPAFTASGPLLSILTLAQLAFLVVATGAAMATGYGRPAGPAALAVSTAAAACVLHPVVIPRFGAVGAATVTGVLSWGAAIATVAMIRRISGIVPEGRTVLASTATTIVTSGTLLALAPGRYTVIPVLLGLGVLVPVLLHVLGALGPRDLSLLADALIPGRVSDDTTAAPTPDEVEG